MGIESTYFSDVEWTIVLPTIMCIWAVLRKRVRFLNGTLRPNDGHTLEFQRFTSDDKGGEEQKQLLVAQIGNSTYVGRNYGLLHTTTSDLCRYMVGVVDKNTGKMRVHDTEIFTMQPYRSIEEEDTNTHDVDYAHKRDKLTEAFGSKRKKRTMESRLKNQLSNDKMKSAVDSAIEKTPVLHELVESRDPPNICEVLPPHNKDATTQAEAYPLSGLIDSRSLQALEVTIGELMNCTKQNIAEWGVQEKYPKIILHHAKTLPKERSERSQRCCLLMYLYFMIRFYKLRASQLKQKRVMNELRIPRDVFNHMCRLFTLTIHGTIERVMPTRLKNRLLCHILVLCLILDHFTLEYLPLCADLMIKQAPLTSTLRSLGCITSSMKRDGIPFSVAQLKVPLVFPEPRTAKPARR